MLSWAHLARGAGLSALLEVLVMLAVPRWRRPRLIITSAVIGFAAPFGWQAVLKLTHSYRFYTDLPVSFFPISYQDTGSGRCHIRDPLAHLGRRADAQRARQGGREPIAGDRGSRPAR
jgi:hypothetical protein